MHHVTKYCNVIGPHCTGRWDTACIRSSPDPSLLLRKWVWLARLSVSRTIAFYAPFRKCSRNNLLPNPYTLSLFPKQQNHNMNLDKELYVSKPPLCLVSDPFQYTIQKKESQEDSSYQQSWIHYATMRVWHSGRTLPTHYATMRV